VQEVELGQVSDLSSLDRALEGEVEVVQGLGLREPSGLHPVLTSVVLTRGDLLGKHRGEVGLVVPGLGAGPLG